ncbi:MAG: hypothetical protein F6J86_23045 [Symploca sp. SIO1B1]|nr:hypothetical protein [Symploca sp. SIO1B1]
MSRRTEELIETLRYTAAQSFGGLRLYQNSCHLSIDGDTLVSNGIEN